MILRKNLLFFLILVSALILNKDEIKAVLRFDLENLAAQNADFITAYRLVHVQEAWDSILRANKPLNNIVVGIVDTGVDKSHQEFNDPSVNFGESSSVALHDSYQTGHGTQVSGIIAANNVLGSGGSLALDSPQMNGILTGVLNKEKYIIEEEGLGGAKSSRYIEALKNILKRNPTIVNMSFVGTKCADAIDKKSCIKSDIEFSIVRAAYEAVFNSVSGKKSLFVAAAGNNDSNVSTSLPAAIDLGNVVTVAATNFEDKRASFDPFGFAESNYGSSVDVAVPTGSEGVYAPKPANNYDVPGNIAGFPQGFGKTSAAAPFVTGVAGLIKSIKPELTPAQIKQILIESADSIQTGETDKRLGIGCYANPDDPVNTGCRLNAERAVCHELVLNCAPPPQPCSVGQYFAEYFTDTSSDNPFPGQPTIQRCEDAPLNNDWGLNSPDPAISSENFSARWTGTFNFPTSDTYIFQAITDDGMRVYIDNNLVIDAWFDQSRRSHWVSLPVTAGTHTVKVEYYEHFIDAVAMLDWYIAPPSPQPPSFPCPQNTWTAEYFTDTTSQDPFPGNPDSITCEPFPLNNDWGQGSPAAIISSDNFSARYTGTFFFDQDTTYLFQGIVDDGMRIFIDNIEVYNAWGLHNRLHFEFLSTINTGTHTVRVEYFEQTGNAAAILNWEPYITLTSLNTANTQISCSGYTCISAWGFKGEE